MVTFFGLVLTRSFLGTTFTVTAAFEVVIQAWTTFIPCASLSTAGILTTANLQTGKSLYLTLIVKTDQTKK